MKIDSYEQYVDFVKKVASKYEMIVVQIHNYIFEFGTDITPYFRLLWSPDRLAPVVSFHVDTRNSDAIQLYSQIVSIADNVILADSYYMSLAGETTQGDQAYIAAQVDTESNMIETTTEALMQDQDEPATFISSTPVYTPGDARGIEQQKMKKKIKQGLFHL